MPHSTTHLNLKSLTLKRISLPTSPAFRFSLLLALFAGLLPGLANAGSVTGDAVRVRVFVDDVRIVNTTDTAGSGVLDLCAIFNSACPAGSAFSIFWLDGDSVQVSFSDPSNPSPSNIRFEFEGTDFVSLGGQPEGIMGVSALASGDPAEDRLVISYGINSIELDFADLAPGEAATGYSGQLNVQTSQSLAETYDFRRENNGSNQFLGTGVLAPFNPLSCDSDCSIEWLSLETAEIDWASVDSGTMTLEVSDIAITNLAGKSGTLLGAAIRPRMIPPVIATPMVSVTSDSVTFTYGTFTEQESNDGDSFIFDLLTDVPEVDFYEVEITEDGAPRAEALSARGLSSWHPVVSNYDVRWLDDDSFEIDWFSDPSTSLSWTFRFRDLRAANGGVGVITGVAKSDSGFTDDPSVSFTEDTVTITYASLIDPDSGDSRRFDLTVPEPTLGSSLVAGVLLTAVYRRRSLSHSSE